MSSRSSRAAWVCLPLAMVLLLGISPISFAEHKPLTDRRVVVLASYPQAGEELSKPDTQVFVRELFRQAVLIAAREAMGLRTRDESIGDAAEAPHPEQGFKLVPVLHEPTRFGMGIELQNTSGEALWSKKLKMHKGKPRYLTRLAQQMERWSRADLLEALREIAPSHPVIWNPEAPAPAAVIEQQLQKMTFHAQFDAVRRAHEHIRLHGESPAALGALIRGYAHLGQMTRHHWNGSFKAYRARALLYADRYVAYAPQDPDSHRHRAYALAWIGLHAESIETHQHATQLDTNHLDHHEPS